VNQLAGLLGLYDRPWQAYALCAQVGPGPFYPEKGENATDAKRICAACPVQPDCLDWALATREPHGIWGGTSERERRKLTTHHDTAKDSA
jgi:WhiB family redox-sensing transcriptional regulator